MSTFISNNIAVISFCVQNEIYFTSSGGSEKIDYLLNLPCRVCKKIRTLQICVTEEEIEIFCWNCQMKFKTFDNMLIKNPLF